MDILLRIASLILANVIFYGFARLAIYQFKVAKSPELPNWVKSFSWYMPEDLKEEATRTGLVYNGFFMIIVASLLAFGLTYWSFRHQ